VSFIVCSSIGLFVFLQRALRLSRFQDDFWRMNVYVFFLVIIKRNLEILQLKLRPNPSHLMTNWNLHLPLRINFEFFQRTHFLFSKCSSKSVFLKRKKKKKKDHAIFTLFTFKTFIRFSRPNSHIGENLGFNYQLNYHNPCNIHQFWHWKPIW
jgi:hypothetical protein